MSGLSRRSLLRSGVVAAVLAPVAMRSASAAALTQPPLPFADTALAPTISAQTVQFHYGKHHAAYYANLNRMIPNTPYADLPLEQIVVKTGSDPTQKALFNQAGQAWNHDFYWQVLKPGSGSQPSGKLAQALERDFGGFVKFKEAYAQRANAVFGSGWAWLIEDGGKLALMETSNADTPIAHGKRPLAVIDVWEHAYYLDYQNRRPDHVKAVLDNLMNWDFVRDRMTS
ncbi:superoxide dismutase, Fe-Mn family [Enhydrobacter aerosaccus]|uniref:Superoxide dismutase n=1 Tax=Enhydrobacter aerosaccus TaxID=225324 RepID=A0A1T4NJM1_9HYPH|nr:superoxide dismutase [Enhydrobacter aerosaccus]SJZ79315.1 superoxide dismutase, Fe-Mn family [Enhydrobacter aerosaccus]